MGRWFESNRADIVDNLLAYRNGRSIVLAMPAPFGECEERGTGSLLGRNAGVIGLIVGASLLVIAGIVTVNTPDVFE